MADLVNVCGLWKTESKNGTTYMAGKIKEGLTIPSGSRMMVFKVKEKKSDKSPDYTVCYAPAKKEQAAQEELPMSENDSDF